MGGKYRPTYAPVKLFLRILVPLLKCIQKAHLGTEMTPSFCVAVQPDLDNQSERDYE
ncbi:hypothetical protein [Sphingobacterium griseoflavum]|uniref:hypothetical protein n=1 Tax=Sphingobacterium griseoflavum TaxID=1474952 RepID=UPI0036313409